jgi:hypothetical protein
VKATGSIHPWEFRSRFRRHAFGWRSQPAIQRIKQAVSEIRKTARRDPVLGAEGAVLLLERISAALENVDSSSGAIWADRLIGITRLALSPDPTVRGYYCGTSACLSALYRAERYQEIVELLDRDDIIWPYRRWAVKALGALGRTSAAIQYAESCRGPWTSDYDVERVCEDILLVSGLAEDAYRYGLHAYRARTYVRQHRDAAATQRAKGGRVGGPAEPS